MPVASFDLNSIISTFASAFLGRFAAELSIDDRQRVVDSVAVRLGEEPCLFTAILNSGSQLPKSTREWMLATVRSGLSLRLAWPRDRAEAIEEWLGPRFYFSACANFETSARYLSLVCSQIGRQGNKLPNWPALVDAALQASHRYHERPLILAATSLSEVTSQFAQRADLRSLLVQVDDNMMLENWFDVLFERLKSAHQDQTLHELAAEYSSLLLLSPPLADAEGFTCYPVQDRAAMALADRVFAVHVRKGGTIAGLLTRRLADPRFATGSVFVASTLRHSNSLSERQLKLDEWLERGAVGWLLPEPDVRLSNTFAGCSKQSESPFVQSLTAPYIAPYTAIRSDVSIDENEWPFLSHCTRANAGPLPGESMEHYWDRAWTQGSIPVGHSILTLHQILQDQRIKGNSSLTRSQLPCVSFSEVPLHELLSRRQFRSHLGRWDWEPYGIMIRREVLERLGARPVIYGEEADYKQLADHDKPYFQPRGKKSTRNNQDWTIEREWRVLGDLVFAELPRDSILVFVATRAEAQQFARRFPWAVVWKNA